MAVHHRPTDHLNPFCTIECIRKMSNGRLECACADTRLYEWRWRPDEDDDNDDVMNQNGDGDGSAATTTVLSAGNTHVVFFPVYSVGTAFLRGDTPFEINRHHYWEIKVLSYAYGTDVMVGVGTAGAASANWKNGFYSALGSDDQSWGYSYNGFLQHNHTSHRYDPGFGLGSLVGVHLDMCTGRLEFYLNRKPLGTAFNGLKRHRLYPMVASTAAKSAMKITCATSTADTLQLRCLQLIRHNPILFRQFKNLPGVARIFESTYFWLLHDPVNAKRKKFKNNEDDEFEVKKSKDCTTIYSRTMRFYAART